LISTSPPKSSNEEDIISSTPSSLPMFERNNSLPSYILGEKKNEVDNFVGLQLPFLNYDKLDGDKGEHYELEDSGLAFASTGSDSDDDEEIGTFLRHIKQPPSLKLTEDESNLFLTPQNIVDELYHLQKLKEGMFSSSFRTEKIEAK
jgi:hypothetical protein